MRAGKCTPRFAGGKLRIEPDGSLTGPLWYLYFRRVEHLDDDAARAKAERLGLKFGERDQRLGWLAVQDFLAKNP
jgi:hypothetical protein